MAKNISEITILIKTIKRPELCQRLVSSIKTFYPEVKILVLDDEDDMGVSAGRNELVRMCETKYCMLLDDDCIFTPYTNIEKVLEMMGDYDMVGLEVLEKGRELNYKGRYEVDGSVVKMVGGEPLEFIPNVFIAKTESLRKYPWDEEYKIGEHFAYFFSNRGKLKIGYTKEASVIHDHKDNPEYRTYRIRATDFVKKFMADNGITRRIDLSGCALC